MPKRNNYHHIRHAGVVFAFKYDAPGLLHIQSRHECEIDDALDIWFDPSCSQGWNAECARYERANQTHGMYWTWRQYDGAVLVITCFRLEK